MTKQEEIEKGVEVALCGGMLIGTELYEEDGYYFLTESYREILAKRILSFQSHSGVAIPKERELWQLEKR